MNNNGQVVERYDYDPFGLASVLNADGTAKAGGSGYDWKYLHQGLRYDSGTGLYDDRGRPYSPTLARFVQNDPKGFAAGDMDLYRAYGNSPTNLTDPSGLQPPPSLGDSPSGSVTAFLSSLFNGTPPAVRQSLLFAEPASPSLTLRSPEEARYLLMTPEERAQERIRLLEEAIRQRDAQSERDRQLQALAWWSSLSLERQRMYRPYVNSRRVDPSLSYQPDAATIQRHYLHHQIIENDRPLQSTAGPVEIFIPGPAGLRIASTTVTRLLRRGAATTKGARWSTREFLSAPADAWRPNVPFTYVDDLYARTRLYGAQSTARGIEIQSGLPSLVELGVLRHEYAHQVLSRFTIHFTDISYIASNYARMAEEFGVHLYATHSFSKAFQNLVRSFNAPHFIIETGIYLGIISQSTGRNQGK